MEQWALQFCRKKFNTWCVIKKNELKYTFWAVVQSSWLLWACGCASKICHLCIYRLFCGCTYFASKCWTFLQEADTDPTGEAAHKTQQTLTFYELDLGLNHVVRKYSEPLEEHANFLVSVPGGNDGPSGVLICSENYLTYKNLGDQHDIRCPIPRRRVMFISMLALIQCTFFPFLRGQLGWGGDVIMESFGQKHKKTKNESCTYFT